MQHGGQILRRQATWVAGLLLAGAAANAVQAAEVTTYGAGLESCTAYLKARDPGQVNPTEVAFVDWLSGYFSGANKASTHRDNVLGLSDLGATMSWLDAYCRVRPQAPLAEAAGMLLLGAKPGPTTHTLEVTTYGSADKACQAYVAARGQQDLPYWEEFLDWLGGYVSGVNATSLHTDNILGSSQLTEAVAWLDTYCAANPQTSFGAAVDTLLSAKRPVAIRTARAGR